jgi:hypothetical protein
MASTLVSPADAVTIGPATPSASSATRRAHLLETLGLTLERPLSDDGDSFVTLVCLDAAGARVVLKYVSNDSPDAYRRLANESRLFASLRVPSPLRFLSVRAAERGYLVTAFDPGVLLGPATIGDDRVVPLVAEALVRFQTADVRASALGIADRERLSTYYVKVLVKHIVHVWPSLLTAAEAAKCLATLTASIPAIGARRVPCHGDFMPTNLLYNAEAATITFSDLEGFMTANHPLFDVLALCTVTDRDLDDWEWQTRFLGEYLRRASEVLRLEPHSRRFREAYRGILIFFLVYRLNESRLVTQGRTYFDGVAKAQYVRRKAWNVATRREHWRDAAIAPGVEAQARNLRCALNPGEFRHHFNSVLAAAQLERRPQRERRIDDR